MNKTTLIVDSGKTKSSKQRLNAFLSIHETDFRSVRRFGCIAAHAAMLNSHQPFASLTIDASAHDLCPASLIFKQAGLTTLNASGNPWSPADRDLIAFHPALTSEITPILRSLTQPPDINVNKSKSV